MAGLHVKTKSEVNQMKKEIRSTVEYEPKIQILSDGKDEIIKRIDNFIDEKEKSVPRDENPQDQDIMTPLHSFNLKSK